jgi:hypothetical protein
MPLLDLVKYFGTAGAILLLVHCATVQKILQPT